MGNTPSCSFICTQMVTRNLKKFAKNVKNDPNLHTRLIVDVNHWFDDFYKKERTKYLSHEDLEKEKRRDIYQQKLLFHYVRYSCVMT